MLPTHGYIARYGVGEVFTDGFERIYLHGRPGVLLKVEMVGPSVDHLRVIGIRVAGPRRRIGGLNVADGYPPRMKRLGHFVPAEGARLFTGPAGNVLQIGIRVVKPGLAIRTGVRIYYTVDGEKYTALLPGSIAVCPDGMTDDQCESAYLELQTDPPDDLQTIGASPG